MKKNYTINCSENYLHDILMDDSIIPSFYIESDDNISCYNISLNEQLCIKCNKDYYEIENDNYSSSGYIKCYKDPIGYYLDNNIYKKCFLHVKNVK